MIILLKTLFVYQLIAPPNSMLRSEGHVLFCLSWPLVAAHEGLHIDSRSLNAYLTVLDPMNSTVMHI